MLVSPLQERRDRTASGEYERISQMIIKGARQSPQGGHIIVIVLFAMIAGLSGLLTVPPLDRDESRFVQATTQMIETGDYVRIRYQEEERNKKPIGIHWLQAASVLSLADVEDRPLWAYRLPSLLSAALAAASTYLAGCALFGARAGFAAALLLAAAPVVMGEASIAKTDAALLAAVSGMQAALVWVLTAERKDGTFRTVLLMWLALAAGVLIKGPIAPIILLTTIGSVIIAQRAEKNWKNILGRLRPILGGAIAAIVVAPWLVGIGIATEGRFFTEAIGGDMMGKVAEGQETHAAPPGAHLLMFWLMFWPASLFILAAGRHAGERWREGPYFFCFAWLVPTWILFELSLTKLPHYTMPLYPAIALLCGQLIASVGEDKYPALRRSGAIIFSLIGTAAVLVALYFASLFSSAGLVIWHYLGAVLIICAMLTAAALSWRRQSGSALTAAILASALLAWGTFEGVLPTLDKLAMTPRIAAMLDAHEAHPLKDDTGPVGLVGYHEPSAVFTFGTKTKLLLPSEGAIWLTTAKGRALVVEERDEPAFFAALPQGVEPVRVASIEGFNYSKNRDIRLTLFRMPD